MLNKKEIVLKLFEIGAIKFGDFTLKSGIQSPIYIDLRITISYPKLLSAIAEAIWDRASMLKFDLVCGVPYTAIPFATLIAVNHNIPMLMRRKEAKAHGTKKIIEGIYEKGQTCLIIEDIITSGASIFETIEPVEEIGLKVADIIVLIDREQNGKAKLSEKGYNLHAVFTLTAILDILVHENKIAVDTQNKVLQFLQQNQF